MRTGPGTVLGARGTETGGGRDTALPLRKEAGEVGMSDTDRAECMGGGRKFTEFPSDNHSVSEGGLPVKRLLQEVSRT